MNRLIQAKIDVTKINKELLFKGQKGTYLDLNLWIKDEPDQYGNICSIEQRTEQGAEKIYLGNGKEWKRKEEEPTQAKPQPKKRDDDEFPF